MRLFPLTLLATILFTTSPTVSAFGQDSSVLPRGVKAVWDISSAYRETTATRERISINGLWQWQPGVSGEEKVPTDRWGYFKVPGCWPGITDYMQKDCQTVFAHPSWKGVKMSALTAAWYQREIEVPKDWAGRRIALSVEYLNSQATVYIDGRKAGDMSFPAGEVDLTAFCPAGSKHLLSMLVVARPMEEVMLMFGDTNAPKRGKSRVERRGLCGDVYLVSTPAGPRIEDVKVDTWVRKGEITLGVMIERDPYADYTLRAVISDKGRIVKEFTREVRAGELMATEPPRRVKFHVDVTEKWKPDKLWDINTPENTFDVSVSLLGAGGGVLDTALPVRFGFREFWIDGRDFYLNGTRIFLSALPVENAAVSAATASYDAVKESLLRLKEVGINFVYTHNYGCEPGSHLSFEELLRAADDVGMLVAFSQPHFAQYDWTMPDADAKNGYAQHARFYVHAAGNHPSVVFYSMSHNATGYDEDLNPDLIDGIHAPRDQWAANNVKRALRAEAIVNRLDPGRIVYHHSSGNLGSMHDSNFYTNMAPAQELDDWFEHWATKGVKPLFTCEYMVPCTWDFTMYRGWYKGVRTWGEAQVPWEFCVAEWSSQFLGDRAYQIGEPEKKNLRWEAQQFRDGRLWHRWDYPHPVGSPVFESQHAIIGMYLTDNWRAFRTWGVSAISPWESNFFWSLRDGVDKGRKPLKVDWANLQRPGYSPDYLGERYERMDLAYERTDWVPTADGQAILRNNRPLLAFIAGKKSAFTSKDHNFYPGETVEKQLIIINNSRKTVTADAWWEQRTPEADEGDLLIPAESITTGQQVRIPLRLDLPARLAPGKCELSATVNFSNGEVQDDSFAIQVVPRPASPKMTAKLALWDPKGQTAEVLKKLGIEFASVEAGADLSGYDILVVGKEAFTTDGPGPDVSRVRKGLKVVLFEQTADVLEKRFGFRTAQYGLRQVFPRVPDHPLLAGLNQDTLRDWRGEATLLPPRLEYSKSQTFGGPAVRWCDIEVPHVWRCGNRGNVASVLIEKPARGDFLPILDGGYSLEYAPLMEYREGKGLVLLCQIDVSGRTEQDPAAETLVRNLLQYAADWKPAPRRSALYTGEPAGRRYLEFAGVGVGSYEGGSLAPENVLVVAAGGGPKLAENAAAIAEFLKAGGNIMALGLDASEANAFLPAKITTKKAEHIAAFFEPPAKSSLLAGVSPADVHNRDPKALPLVTQGAAAIGDGVLATAREGNVVFCQFPPYTVTKVEGAEGEPENLRRTYRHTAFQLARLLGNMGVSAPTPLLERFRSPAAAGEKRWLEGFYLDRPVEWDDPYRFFRW